MIAQGDISFSGVRGYAQAGSGGLSAGGNLTGTLALSARKDITISTGSEASAYAQIGHGAASGTATGTRRGNITLLTGDDLVLQGGVIGHRSSDGASAILDGNTLIGISQNNPAGYGKGQILATNVLNHPERFNSAFGPTGQLRFYVPEADNVTIPAGTLLNSESYPGASPPTA